MTSREQFEAEWRRMGWGDESTKEQCFAFWESARATPTHQASAAVSDEKLSDMIENADGMRCIDGEYRIEGRDLMNLARAIAAARETIDSGR